MKKSAGKVTPEQRRLAVLHDRDRAVVERLGIPAAGKVGFDLQRAVLAAFRRGQSWLSIREKIVRPHLARLRPLVLDGMLAAHLNGASRTLATVGNKGPKSLELRLVPRSPYAAAVKALRQRMQLPLDLLDAIQAAYEIRALRVLDDTTEAVERTLEAAILETARRGEHIREGIKALREAFGAAGIAPQNSYTLENLFRTQTQMAYGAGRWQASQDEAIQEILWGYTYVTVGDDRVRPEHVGLDGVTLPKDDSMWRSIWPPNGYSCRCSTIEVFAERDVVRPPDVIDVGGKEYAPGPDKGFSFNPGMWFDSMANAT